MSINGFKNAEENDGVVIWDDIAATASTQADRTAESGSRRRRWMVEIILDKKGARTSPWELDSRARRETHCLRTGGLEEESVL